MIHPEFSDVDDVPNLIDPVQHGNHSRRPAPHLNIQLGQMLSTFSPILRLDLQAVIDFAQGCQKVWQPPVRASNARFPDKKLGLSR